MGALDLIKQTFDLDFSGKPPYKINMSRENLAQLFCSLGYRVGAEVGVERGVFSERICQLNPGVRLHSIDAWTAYKGYRDHVTQEKLDGFYRDAIERLEKYGVDVIKGFSQDISKIFKNDSLDFVYIDGAHDFLNVSVDICSWVPKVRKGGIISGHDFKRDKGKDWVCHVKDVVHAYTYSHGINPWFVTTQDRSNSWFWVKEN